MSSMPASPEAAKSSLNPLKIRKAQNIEPMVDGHDDHVAAHGEIGSVVIGRRSGTGGETAAVAPEHDRPLAAASAAGADRQASKH